MRPILNGCDDTAVWSWRVQIRFLSVGMDEKRSLQRKVNTRDELVARIVNSAALTSKNAKTTPGELYLLLPRGLKSALKSMVGFLNIYCELLRFIEIIYITNKYNQYVICLSFIPFVRVFMRNIQTAVSPHPLKSGHVYMNLFTWKSPHYRLLKCLLFLLKHPVDVNVPLKSSMHRIRTQSNFLVKRRVTLNDAKVHFISVYTCHLVVT